MVEKDIHYMQCCLELAAKSVGQTSPNPLVGCVIVKNGKVLSQGYHKQAGLPHAEIEALKKIHFDAKGATLYCNLEPCFHYGRTPPCVHRIIESGIKRIVIAHRDPNPLTSGRSVRLLKSKGVKVTEGVAREEALFLNRFFVAWVKKKRPYVILKVAMSLDGKIFRGSWIVDRGSKKHEWITGPLARRRVHEIRSQVDAILVGVNTILADNPRLNVRGIPGAKQPIRIVLDTHRKTPSNARIFHSKGGEAIIMTSGHQSLRRLLKRLAEREIISLLVEGGAKVFYSFLQAGLVDEMELFVTPKIIGPRGLEFRVLPEAIKKMTWRINRLYHHGDDFEIQLLRDRLYD